MRETGMWCRVWPVALACGLSAAAPAAEPVPAAPAVPPAEAVAAQERDAERLMQAWSTRNLAPVLIDHCARKFPDKAEAYRRALADWLAANAGDAEQGRQIYAVVVAAKAPGNDPDAVLAESIGSIMARFAVNGPEKQLQQCDSAYLTLMIGSD
ncbi:MAG: hypothetical protein ACOY33_08360 [Pseudomonadota bacterium]